MTPASLIPLGKVRLPSVNVEYCPSEKRNPTDWDPVLYSPVIWPELLIAAAVGADPPGFIVLYDPAEKRNP
jgi:hypothetical protein